MKSTLRFITSRGFALNSLSAAVMFGMAMTAHAIAETTVIGGAQ